MNIYNQIASRKEQGLKQFAILLDPDKSTDSQTEHVCRLAAESCVDYIFVGGSLLTNGNLPDCIKKIKSVCSIPVVLFPGNNAQIDKHADAILFLSLISGRNPDLLIGNHVNSAPIIREKKLEAIPTGYMLIDSGRPTSALYMSNTLPIPADKPDIAACTAMAGEMLGLKMIFMDAGSGAGIPITEDMIKAVKKSVDLPLIVGGGIKTAEKAFLNCKAGADMIVVGNIIEKNPSLIKEIAEAVKSVPVTH